MKQYLTPYSQPIAYQSQLMEIQSGVSRHVHAWTPLHTTPACVVTIFHGLGDHGARFANLANAFASAGIAVVAPDLIGHGRSPGYRGIITSYDALLDEIGNSVYLGDRLYPDLPKFVLGQSMGGNLVLNWSMRRPFEAKSIQGVIAMAPMLRMARAPSQNFLRVGQVLARWFPNFRLSAPVNVKQLCSDPSGQDAYDRDRLVHRKISLLLGQSLMESGEWAIQNADTISKPTLLMHGLDDTLTSPTASEEFVHRACGDVSINLWPNCRHELHFELQRERVIERLLHWIQTRLITAERKHLQVA